jgi:hypothetical protein
MNPHVHVFPVDPSQTADEAWHELCIMGVRATYTGPAGWATISCDGEECWRIPEDPNKEAANG